MIDSFYHDLVDNAITKVVIIFERHI